MPRVFLPQSGPVEANVQFAQVPPGAVRLSTGSVQQALNNVGDAISRTPKVQAEDFSGVIALGKGIKDMGRYMAEMAHREQQITNAHVALKFQNATARARAEINGIMDTEPDPMAMQRRVEEVISETQKGLDFGEASAHQKELLNSGMEQFVANTLTGAKYGAIRTRQRNFLNDTAATRSLAVENEDIPAVAGVYQAQLAAGVITPEQAKAGIVLDGARIRERQMHRVSKEIEGDLYIGDFASARDRWAQTWGHVGDNNTPDEQYAKRSIEAQIQKAEVVQTFNQDIDENPDELAGKLSEVDDKGVLKNYPEMPYLDRHAYLERARKAKLRNSVEATERVMNDIANGTIKNLDQIKAVKGLQPKDWDTLENMLRREQPSEEVWAETINGVLNMQVSDDPEVRLHQQLKAAQQASMWAASSPQRFLLMSKIEEKFKDPSADPDVDDSAKLWVNQTLATGAFGGVAAPYEPPQEYYWRFWKEDTPGTPLQPKDEKKGIKAGTLVVPPESHKALLKNTIILNEEINRLKRLPGATPDSVLKGVQAKAASLGAVDALTPRPTAAADVFTPSGTLFPLTGEEIEEANKALMGGNK